MKIKLLAPSLILAAFSSTLFFSCRKDQPTNPPPSTDSTVNLKNGLLVYLPFSGNIADSSGNNNPTQLVGSNAGLTNDMNGHANAAFGGDGTGGRIEVTNNGSIKFDTAFTVSVNFMEHSAFGRQVLASMVKVEDGKGPSFLVGNSIPGSSNVWFGVVNSSSTCDEYGNGKTTVDTTTFVPQAETWYNLISTFYKGSLKVYLNGKLISETSSSDPYAHICPNAKFVVGGWWQADPVSINGKLDEVRLYNRALNAAEIAKLAQGFGEPPTPPAADLQRGLLVYLPFNGSTADSSGHNNPTQIVGYGGGLTYDMHGYANSAWGSNGAGGRLLVTNNGSIQFDTAFTIALSFMELDNSNRQIFASMVKVESAKGVSFGIGNSIPGQTNVWFGVANSTAACDDFSEGHTTTDTTTFIPQPGRWYNLVSTFRKGTLKVYLNGQLISQKTTSDPYTHVCPDAKLVIGGWWDNDPISINGALDNVRLYNRELTSDEIGLLSKYYQPTTNSVRRIVTH